MRRCRRLVFIACGTSYHRCRGRVLVLVCVPVCAVPDCTPITLIARSRTTHSAVAVRQLMEKLTQLPVDVQVATTVVGSTPCTHSLCFPCFVRVSSMTAGVGLHGSADAAVS
jgi:glucosamine 6-phosphate synthetase-like amidotransferase/phosphosugar isomerase protein